MKFLITVIMALSVTTQALHSQSWLYPETISPFNPLRSASRPSHTEFLKSLGIWGEFGRYIFKRDGYHNWSVSLGGTAEIAGGANWNALLESHLHLVVDPNNDISFNPRAFMWEEGVLIGVRTGDNIWQFGYQHRCKHDIDNLELFRTTKREEERALIYGSGMARWETVPLDISQLKFRPLLEAHIYLKLQDQRFPVDTRTIEPNVESLLGAIRMQATFIYTIREVVRPGVIIDARVSFYGLSPDTRFRGVKKAVVEPGVEIFCDFIGKTADMRLFLRYVYLYDDFIPPIPRSANLFAIGMRIISGW